MRKPVTHLRTTYYRPSWQGGDLELARCQKRRLGFVCQLGDDVPLVDERQAVTCKMCLKPMKASVECEPAATVAEPIPRPPVPRIITTPLPPSGEIIREVAERSGLTVAELKSPSRARHITQPRQEAMWELRRRTRLSFGQIARILGLSDHTSVVWGVRSHQARLEGRAA